MPISWNNHLVGFYMEAYYSITSFYNGYGGIEGIEKAKIED
ncbi:MAG: hypothetical protein E6507_06505 [Prevotella bivia]|uniref:Uncharacterized protein n=1 Tax=Prevotella bivia TaxID=28125 RepID=A0A137SYR2_9BACT|nr:hypothetical protein [Prevotella bivia]KXO17547.1 hypothetical protein HMPREF3202_01002 [Prevotella bivia]KXU57176.1 hypothetical protein HMPREF3218_0201574 [Prevotella bivia]MDK7762718.1 hypothetical protein [Prevotella bivia]MDU2114091.1 hypothetical protein [Prevotella bivia]MDU2329106.1 hypothetical protein [Prevotella bivia]